MYIFFQNNQYLSSYYFTRSADDPVYNNDWEKGNIDIDYHKTFNLVCTNDDHCRMMDPSKPKCDTSNRRCQECLTTHDCWGQGGDQICSDNRCVTTEGLSYIMMIEKKVTLTLTIIKLLI